LPDKPALGKEALTDGHFFQPMLVNTFLSLRDGNQLGRIPDNIINNYANNNPSIGNMIVQLEKLNLLMCKDSKVQFFACQIGQVDGLKESLKKLFPGSTIGEMPWRNCITVGDDYQPEEMPGTEDYGTE
jgi:hypothetical protein